MSIVKTYSDKRGTIEWHEFHGVSFNLVFSKAGSFRGGDVHPNRQFGQLLKGRVRVTRAILVVGEEDEELTDIHSEFDCSRMFINKHLPHLYEYLEDTVHFEWWDSPFKADYYPRFRKIVEESLK